MKAGDRYEERTGNLWAFANRGDLTGLKTALARGVDVNLANTVGWTAAHAAAAGGQTKALRFLSRVNADLEKPDRGGNLPVHEAAKNGHLQALAVLQELGADVTRVRLSQAKGQAVRKFLSDALRKAGVQEEEEGLDENDVVGYARKQSKSTAFWGPRRTPISGKIKKKILKQKRLRRQACDEQSQIQGGRSSDEDEAETEATGESELGFKATVQQVKRNVRRGRQQRRSRAHTEPQAPKAQESEHLRDAGPGRELDCESGSAGESGIDEPEADEPLPSGGRFAALALGGSDSDSESDGGSDSPRGGGQGAVFLEAPAAASENFTQH